MLRSLRSAKVTCDAGIGAVRGDPVLKTNEASVRKIKSSEQKAAPKTASLNQQMQPVLVSILQRVSGPHVASALTV